MSKERILVIEDDTDNRALVVFLLESEGFQVLQSTDGKDGLEKVTVEQPDLVLLDMSIPEIDGWKLARQLKENENLRSIPVVALTGHTMPGDRQKALDAGCDGYITKPLDINSFAEQVREFLRAG
jgi:two-component system, cell cycle response regulator DivK